MKNLIVFALVTLLSFGCSEKAHQSYIRINQLGYQPGAIKVAVMGSKDQIDVNSFTLHDANTNNMVASFDNIESKGAYGPFETSFRLDFSDFQDTGSYYIKAKNKRSPVFRIDNDVYDGTADFLLKYMRQQRCGYNPYLKDSCHVDDGFIIYHPEKPDGTRLDVIGGWHDATDYLQYTATSANAVYQLLYSYRENPEAFGDLFQNNGDPGANGIPDVIDEAKHGMDWLIKMNPSPNEYYNQIADDRDHVGYRLPNKDSVVYHPDFKGRPIYFVNGEIQGLFENKNRTTGVSSTAGKFASSFGIGAEVLAPFYPEYANKLTQKSKDAYAFGKTKPGNTQTAPATAPYFYEEDNWVDDMELAAAVLYKLTNDKTYYSEALNYASNEKTTPWMGRDTARHYQYYPFYNAGHNELALVAKTSDKKMVTNYYKSGLEAIYQRGKDNPFLIGVPFIWCSNNLVTATLTQAKAYKELTGDTTYDDMEASLRDWLFGCNPWGTSMIVGLPEGYGDSPIYPHSSLNHLHGYQTDGGLVDGPVYGTIFNNLKGLELTIEDPYADVQSDYVVYHDDVGDYSTNEPTMDGTACLVFYLSALEADAKKKEQNVAHLLDETGAIVRGNVSEKKIHLVFTGHEYADGGDHILQLLRKENIKASFFFTGDFYRNHQFSGLISELISEGHYLGAHSDKHLLYNDWSPDKKRLVSENEFTNDLLLNYAEMKKFGIEKKEAPFYLPPYEWNDSTITSWTEKNHLTLINYTKGTLSHADYTTPSDKNYRSSATIYNSILEHEAKESLNGFLLLSHIGTHPDRTDKFYLKLGSIISTLKQKEYHFVSLNEMLE